MIEVFIPKELEAVEDDIRRFFDCMVFKLRKNAHKGDWEGMTTSQALNYLRGEVSELTAAIEEGSSAEIAMESADVANFALMASSIAFRSRAARFRQQEGEVVDLL